VEQVTGIGGFFFRAKDPLELARWYETNLGVTVFPATDEWWMQEAGPTVLAPFEIDTDYFGRADQQAMVNFRVRDLDAIREQLRALTDASVGPLIPKATDSNSGSLPPAWVTHPPGDRP
jgi:hypothetical protein